MVVAGCAAGPQGDADWSIAFEGGCDASTRDTSAPVVRGNLVYAGSSDGAVYAFHRASGATAWRFQTGAGLTDPGRITVLPSGKDPANSLGVALAKEREREQARRPLVTATPVVAAGTVYVGSWDSKLYALDATTGAVKWSRDENAPIPGAVVVLDDRMLYATGRSTGRIVARNNHTGEVLWAHEESTANWPSHALLVHQDTLYLTNWNAATLDARRTQSDPAESWLRALDTATGKTLWDLKLAEAWPSAPAIAGEHLVFMTTPRNRKNVTLLHGVERATGRLTWTYEGAGGPNYWKGTSTPHLRRAPYVTSAGIVIFASDTHVAGIDARTGREHWRLGAPFASDPINKYAVGPLAYVLTGDTMAVNFGHLHGIDPATGKIVWSTPMASRASIEAVDDRRILVRNPAIGPATLFAYDALTGRELGVVWQHNPFGNESNQFCAGPVVAGNAVLFATGVGLSSATSRDRGRLRLAPLPSP
jgi:outer membrane protein assembly factor BamB